MRTVFAIPLLALVLSAAAPVHAQDGSAEPTPAQVKVAAEAFDKGREAYKAEEYVEAAEQFEKADSNAPSAAALELAIRARDKAGELDRAATLMALALKRNPNDDNLLKVAAELSHRASAELYEVNVTCDQPCDLTVGGKIIHGAPDTQRTLYLKPGALTVRAGWSDNRNDSKQIQAEKGGKGEASFIAPSTPASDGMAREPSEPVAPIATNPEVTPDTGKKSSGWSPAVFFVGVGVTALVGGVTIWSGVDTVNNPGKDAVKKGCVGQGPECDLYQDGLSKQRRTNVLIGVTAGVGVATILIGALATNWSGGKAAAPASDAAAAKLKRPGLDVVPWASLDAGGIQAIGRF